MRRLLILFVICLLFNSCNSYTNKDKYQVNIGETVEIYYSGNSCCYNCISNERDLKHTKLIDRKMIDPGPKDCEGCSFTGVFFFRAQSAGIDTVKIKIIGGGEDCDSTNDAQAEKYIIEVK